MGMEKDISFPGGAWLQDGQAPPGRSWSQGFGSASDHQGLLALLARQSQGLLPGVQGQLSVGWDEHLVSTHLSALKLQDLRLSGHER